MTRSANSADLDTAAAGILTMQAQLVRHIAGPLVPIWNDEGRAVLTKALTEFGRWRGEQLRRVHAKHGIAPSAGALALYWDNCDLHLARLRGGMDIRDGAGSIEFLLTADPVIDYIRQAGYDALAESYIMMVLPAVTAAYNSSITVTVSRDDGQALTVAFQSPSSTPTSRPVTALLETKAVIRKSAHIFGALYFFLAREILERLGASGEQHLREATRTVGRERGEALRAAHLAKGLPINLESLLKNYDSPISSAFEWVNDGILTAKRWHQDCSYCPFFDVWQELGGQRIGWIYDEELHPALNQAYHPGVQIKFSANKNLGDKVCGFRFDIIGESAPKITIVERPR